MSIRERLDISAYLVIGPENCTRPVEEIVAAAVGEGFTCVQIRSKIASAREMISLLKKSAQAIHELGKSDSVALLGVRQVLKLTACTSDKVIFPLKSAGNFSAPIQS